MCERSIALLPCRGDGTGALRIRDGCDRRMMGSESGQRRRATAMAGGCVCVAGGGWQRRGRRATSAADEDDNDDDAATMRKQRCADRRARARRHTSHSTARTHEHTYRPAVTPHLGREPPFQLPNTLTSPPWPHPPINSNAETPRVSSQYTNIDVKQHRAAKASLCLHTDSDVNGPSQQGRPRAGSSAARRRWNRSKGSRKGTRPPRASPQGSRRRREQRRRFTDFREAEPRTHSQSQAFTILQLL